MAPPRIRTLSALRDVFVGRSASVSASDLRSALLGYDGHDLGSTARWQSFIATTSFFRPWARHPAPFSTTLMDTDDVRIRLLYWRPGLLLPFHDHPGIRLVGLRVLAGSPLQEHIRYPMPLVGGTLGRELAPGMVSVLPGAGAEHRLQGKFDDRATHTLQVEIPDLP